MFFSKIKNWRTVALIIALVVIYQVNQANPIQSTKHRIIVTTDITNEPDDQESLVRLLGYSNDFDIEGLIG